MKSNPLIYLTFILLLFAASCKEKTEVLDSDPIEKYFPLSVGKYITYRLDSTVFLPFGTSSVIKSYEVRLVNEAEITDNIGRKAYRIIRYIRKDSTQSWKADATCMSLNDGKRAEFVENNLRFIKLALPIRKSWSWKGNAYIDTYSLFTQLDYLDGWDYQYESIGQPATISGITFPETLLVTQRDEVLGDTSDPRSYAEINIGIEKYAAGIGMIYRKFYHSEYQPNDGGYYTDESYGVEYTIIDHN
jgi:hypothetical protein